MNVTMKIPDSVLSEIVEKIDPVAIVSEYVTLKKKGKNYWGLCPFHTEKTPSFNVSPDNGMFYCYGCHKGGSIFNFIMEIEKVSFLEAVKMLADRAGITLNITQQTSQVEKLKNAIIELNIRVANSLHYILLNSEKAKHALAYLDQRKINLETIKEFRLGYIPPDKSWLFNFLRKKNYSKDFLLKTGLFYERNGKILPYFSNRIIFPIFNNKGDVVGFGGRALSGTITPKYLNTPDTMVFHKKENIFGLFQALKEIREKGRFILVEGYMDVLAMHQAGLKNTVAPLGTAFTENQAYILKRYADSALLAFDGDEAGKKATIRSMGILEEAGINSEIIAFPNSRDPAEIFEKEGLEKLQKVVEYTINSFQYLLKYEISKHNIETPEGKKRIAEAVYSYIDKVESEIKKDSYLNLLAEKLGVDNRAVYNDFIKRRNKSQYAGGSRELDERKKDEQILSSELYFMLFVVSNRGYFEYVRKMITENDLSDELAKDIFIALEESYREEEESLEYLLEKLKNQELKNLIAQKVTSGEFSINVNQAIEDGIRNIKRKSLERRRNEVIKLLKLRGTTERDMDSSKNRIDTRSLLEEKMFLDKELEKLKVR